MAYCRWSSNDFRCDIYCFESDEGYITHVGMFRYVGDIPKIDMSDQDRFLESYRAQQKFIDDAKLEPIDLPYDGMSYADDTPGECAERLKFLRGAGYIVPDDAINELLLEQGELDKNNG